MAQLDVVSLAILLGSLLILAGIYIARPRAENPAGVAP